MTSSQRTLVVVRHAKAEKQAATDAGRPLTEAGLQQAGDTAHWLGAQLAGCTAADTTALVSSAVRARQTWAELAREVPATVRVLGGLYGAGVAEVLTTVQMAETAVRTVLLVGHNPAMHELTLLLATDAPDDGLSPGTAVVLDVTCAWADLGPGCAALRSRHRPAKKVSR